MATRNQQKRRAKQRKKELECAVEAAFAADLKRTMAEELRIAALNELNEIRAGTTNSNERIVARHGPIIRVQT